MVVSFEDGSGKICSAAVNIKIPLCTRGDNVSSIV